MTLAKAVVLDREGRFEEAAAAYESLLLSHPSELTPMMNLALLYWQATTCGVAAHHHLSRGFLQLAERRMLELLDAAEEQFPDHPEVHFWRKYIAWADLGEPFALEDCRDLLAQHPECLEPALAVFSWTKGAEAQAQAMQLLERCARDPTAGCRYVASVINATLLHRRSRERAPPT